MTITMVYSPTRLEVGVMRSISERRRRLVVLCCWGQSATEVYNEALPMLDQEEAYELAMALGLVLNPAPGPGP